MIVWLVNCITSAVGRQSCRHPQGMEKADGRSPWIQRSPVVHFKLDDLILYSCMAVGQNINPLLAICKDGQSLGVLGYLSFRVIVVICDSLHHFRSVLQDAGLWGPKN